MGSLYGAWAPRPRVICTKGVLREMALLEVSHEGVKGTKISTCSPTEDLFTKSL